MSIPFDPLLPADAAGASAKEFSEVADACFAYLVSAPDALAHFMQTTGMSAQDLQANLGKNTLADGMLDYFIGHEPALLALCANSGLSPERLTQLWHKRNPGHA